MAQLGSATMLDSVGIPVGRNNNTVRNREKNLGSTSYEQTKTTAVLEEFSPAGQGLNNTEEASSKLLWAQIEGIITVTGERKLWAPMGKC